MHCKQGIRLSALALGVLLGSGLGTPALADNEVGCGIGTRLMQGKTGLFPHLLASCTNGYTLQSVSLTFNAFGCDTTGAVTADAELRKFAAANIDQLSRDAARGEGESLSALAYLLQLPAEEHGAFGLFVRDHFVELFPNQDVSSNEVLELLVPAARRAARPELTARGPRRLQATGASTPPIQSDSDPL
jgi:hypothetical protein